MSHQRDLFDGHDRHAGVFIIARQFVGLYGLDGCL